VRGKIIFLDDTKGNCFTYNGEKYGLKYDGDHQIIQDDYTTITIANKLEKTLASIEVANQISDNRLYLNHSSATNPVPQDFAENNNTPIRKYLESHSNIAHTGVIITDFIGRFGLSAEDIYRCNLREWTATEKLFNHGYTVKYGTFSDTWTSYIGGCDIQHTGLGGTSDFDREEKSHLYLGHSYVRFFIHVLSGKVKIALVKDNSKGFDDPWETNWHVSSDGTHSYGMEVDANRPYYLAYEYDSGYSHTAQFEVWISISEVGAKG
ncbi:MAG: hypothetical protein LBD38_04520, partial [Streptococcaceae bacterium]|nr:hypothetical protein [Streptococcaceae bacterium]